MVISRDQTGLVINNAGTCAAFSQLHSIKNIAHIGFISDTHYCRTYFFSRRYDRRVTGTGKAGIFLCRSSSFLFLYCLSLIVITAAAYKYSSSQQSTEKDIHGFFHKASLHLNTPQS